MVWYGQRMTLLCFLPVALVGWITLGLAKSTWVIQFARLLLGIYVGCGFNSAGNFVAEISHHSIRGQLSGLVNVARQLGFLFVYIVGSSGITWRQLAFFCGGITIIVPFFGLLTLPDSPRWLASVKRFDEAKQSLIKLRGNIYDVDLELRMIESQVERVEASGTVKQQLKELGHRTILHRFILLNFLYILFSFSGNCCIVTYTATIFKKANNYLNKYQSTIVTGAASALGSLFFLMVGDKYKRKDLMQLPMVLMASCMLSLGFYFYFEDHHNYYNMRWLPLMSIVIHQFFVCFVPINFLLNELLPTSTRSMGGSLIWMFSFIASFVAAYTFPIIEESIGLYGAFWLYSFCCQIFVVCSGLFLPESRGVSLEVLNDDDKCLDSNSHFLHSDSVSNSPESVSNSHFLNSETESLKEKSLGLKSKHLGSGSKDDIEKLIP